MAGRAWMWIAGIAAAAGVALMVTAPFGGDDPPEQENGTSPPAAARDAGAVARLVPVPPPDTDAGATAAAKPPPAQPPKGEAIAPLVGLGLKEATADELRERGLPEKAKGGLIVTSVDPRSSAAEAHLQPGDVIIKAHTTYVKTEDELRAAVGEREHTLIEGYRNGVQYQAVLHKPWVEHD